MQLVAWVVFDDGYLKKYPWLEKNHCQEQSNNQE
jgi:hypothetical protein